jgi:hypothetical protein
MAPTRKVPIKIGDRSKTRHLRYDHISFVRLEEDTGLTISQHANKVANGSAISLTALLWAGLIHAEPELTRVQVAGMMRVQDYQAYAEAITEAQKIAMGPTEEPEGNEGP